MEFFSKLFGAKSKKSVSDGGNAWTTLNTGGSDVSEQNLLLNNKEWVFIAVDKISKAVSSVRFKVMKTAKDQDEEIFDHKLVSFLERPHPQFTGKDFIYLNTAYKELTGNAFWLKGEDGKSISPLIPIHVTPVVKDEELIGYKYVQGVKTHFYLIDKVVHDRYVDPRKPYWGIGKLEKIAKWVDTASYANDFNRLFFLNGASFGGFIETEEESKERIELIKIGIANQHTGVKNAHKIGVLPKGSKFTGATATMQDMQFSELDDRYRDKILAGFGVPKTLAGFTTDVNRASAEASEYIFAKYTIKPIVDDFVEFLNQYIVPMFDNTGQVYISYDNFIPDDNATLLEERKASLANQAYKTINEVRSEVGLPPITGGDSVYGSPFGVQIGEPIVKSSAPKRMRGKKSMSDLIAEKAIEKMSETKVEVKEMDLDELRHKDFVSRVTDYQKQLANKIKDFNMRQKKEVMEKLGRITKAVSKSDIYNYDDEVGIMVDFVTPILNGLATEQAIKEWEDQGFPGVFNPTESNIKKIVELSAKRMSKSYNDTTLLLLKQAINDGIQSGDGVPQIAQRVNDVYEFSDTYRALMTAHTEAFYTANESSREAYKQSGVVRTIRWYTSEDERVCEFCAPMNGKVIDVKEIFFKKGETIQGINGGSMNTDYRSIDVPPLHPNCNCFIRPEDISIDEKQLKTDEDDELDSVIDSLIKEYEQ